MNIDTHQIIRTDTRPNPQMNPRQSKMRLPGDPPRKTPTTLYHHEETSVSIDCGTCAYLIFFRHDGTVESRAFA